LPAVLHTIGYETVSYLYELQQTLPSFAINSRKIAFGSVV